MSKMISSNGKTEESIATYVATNQELSEIHSWLISLCQKEAVVFVGGSMIEGQFRMGRKSAITATMDSLTSADRKSKSPVETAIKELKKTNQVLVFHFHVHPFDGKGGTWPTDKDVGFQRWLELRNLPAIGGVFPRDGRFVRFYAKERSFEVVVEGDGVKHVGNMLFKMPFPGSSK